MAPKDKRTTRASAAAVPGASINIINNKQIIMSQAQFDYLRHQKWEEIRQEDNALRNQEHKFGLRGYLREYWTDAKQLMFIVSALSIATLMCVPSASTAAWLTLLISLMMALIALKYKKTQPLLGT